MKKRYWLLLLLIVVGGIGWTFSHEKSEPSLSYLMSDKEVELWVLSDTHFIAPELYDNGSAFQTLKRTAAGKELNYQTETLTAFVDHALANQPDGIVLTGDLTLNGEKASAEQLSAIFEPLEKAGILVLCIPGNHDINNGWARAFIGDDQLKTEQISPALFQELFAAGYQAAQAIDSDSLSYVINLNSNYQLILLDSCIYQQQASTTQPITNGELSSTTMKWLTKQLQQAEEKKQTPIVFMHHNLYTHNSLLSDGYVLDNAVQLKELLSEYHVPAVFSGHIHTQEIASPENNPHEIVTGSFSTYELTYGQLILDNQQIHYTRQVLDINDWAQQQASTNPDLLDYHAYQAETFITDSEQMAISQLFPDEKADPALLTTTSQLIAELNVNLFTGNDLYTDKERETLRNSPEYEYLQQYSYFLPGYVDSLLTDTTNDQELIIRRQ